MMNLENKKQIAILVLAIGSGLVATTLVGNYIQKNGLPDELKEDLDDQFKPAIKFLNDVCRQAKKLGYVD